MKILIVGGGITGLSAAWYAQKNYPEAQITLIEKEHRLGGWIRTSFEGGFLFEKGPRTFQAARSPHLIELLEELNIETIASNPSAHRRFIYHNKKLRSVGSFLPRLIPYLIRECFIKPSNKEDESIYDFAARRFSPKIAETLFDPLTLGIYAGDIRKLSVRACFPILHKLEQKHGSIVRGMFASKKKSKKKGLFTIPTGMQTLVDELEKRIDCEWLLNTEAKAIDQNTVTTNTQVIEGDLIINALPPEVPKKSLWVVNLAYNEDVLPKKGFGYLIPSKEKETLLGVIFDSAIFPEQNQPHQTRLTAMVQSLAKKPIDTTLETLERHLNIRSLPSYTSSFLAKDAIPQFEVGQEAAWGVSVDACIERGKFLGLKNS